MYISVVTSNSFNGGHTTWRALNDGEKSDYIESVSVRFDKLIFRSDNEKTVWPRFLYINNNSNRAAKGRLSMIVAMTALWYADCAAYAQRVADDREEKGQPNIHPVDLKAGYINSSSRWEIENQEREKSSKIGPIDSTNKYVNKNITYFDLVEDCRDLPISIQSQLVPFCKFLTPRGKRLASQARPINYVGI